jgi:hypothetical protein
MTGPVYVNSLGRKRRWKTREKMERIIQEAEKRPRLNAWNKTK